MIRLVVVKSGLDFRQVWQAVDGRFMAIAFVVYGCGFTLAAYRWYYLLRQIAVEMPFMVVLRLAMIGQFFNLFVPGGVGGDLIKAVYLRKESGDRYPEAVLTVLLDRVLGLFGLLLLGLVGVALNPSLLTDSSPEMRAILTVVALAGVGGMVATVMFTAWPYFSRWGGGRPWADKLPPKLTSIVSRLVEAFSLLRAAPLAVGAILLMAVAGHLFATFSVWIISSGVGGAEQVTFQGYLLSTQLSNLVAAVPLTPGGLGGRDLTMRYLLSQSGASTATSGIVPLAVTALLISWSAIGGLALVWERKHLKDEPGEAHS